MYFLALSHLLLCHRFGRCVVLSAKIPPGTRITSLYCSKVVNGWFLVDTDCFAIPGNHGKP